MNILHLSDIHFGRDNPIYGINEPFEKHDEILSELIRSIKSVGEQFWPEHIVMTGDIAWHGQPEEFAEAYEWFSTLLGELNLTGKDITFCVGNHDVDWGYRCLDEKMTDNSSDTINKYYKYENVELLEPSLYAYDNFCKHIGMIPYSYPANGERKYSYSVGYKDVPTRAGNKLRLVALNTALLIAQPGISEDKMWLGQEQINTLLEYGILPREKDSDVFYSIALYHHSDRFLHPNETSAYDGKCATLPLLQNYTDLLLCGHTESTGRPRLTKQVGGGLLLPGGACYYNDVHFNAYSMIEIDEDFGGMVFYPYIYNNGWQDYDISIGHIDKCKDMPPEGEIIRKAKLEIICGEGEFDTFEHPLESFEINRYEKDGQSFIKIDNHTDYINYYDLEYDGPEDGTGKLEFKLADKWADYLTALYKHDKYLKFREEHEGNDISWRITDEEGTEILKGVHVSDAEKVNIDMDVVNELRMIEFYFGMKFHIPQKFSEVEKRKIAVLKEMAEKDWTRYAIAEKVVDQEFSLAGLNYLSSTLKGTDEVYLRCKKRFSVTLFGVCIDFGEVDAVAGPYLVNTEDLQHKIDTFCEGDKRHITFTAAKRGFVNYVCKDYDSLGEEVSKRLFAVNGFDITLECADPIDEMKKESIGS